MKVRDVRECEIITHTHTHTLIIVLLVTLLVICCSDAGKVSIKRFLKRNLADVEMNALADKAHKQGMPHSDMHSKTWSHYSTTTLVDLLMLIINYN